MVTAVSYVYELRAAISAAVKDRSLPLSVRDDFTHICRVNARLDKQMHDSSLASAGRLAVGEVMQVVTDSSLLHLAPRLFHLDHRRLGGDG